MSNSWIDGFFENSWMRIVRYNSTEGKFKASGISIPNIRAVDNIAALDAIPKTSANNELVVMVRDQPQERNLFIYTHATTRWKTLNTHPIGATANSIMWMFDYPLAHQAGYSHMGTSFLQSARVPYYGNNVTLTNVDPLGAYFRTLRFNRSCNRTTGGSLRFVKSAKTLEWRAPGDSGYGPAVNVSRSGFYRLESASANMDMCCSIEIAFEPAANATDSVDLTGLGSAVISMHGGPSVIGQFNALYGNPWGENQYMVMPSLMTSQSFLASAPDWINLHTDLTVINWNYTGSTATLTDMNTAIARLQTIIQYRQERGSHVIVMTALEHNSASDTKIRLLSHAAQKLQALSYSMGFEIIDTNAYIRDIHSGTLADPLLASNQAADLNRISCRGAYLIAKYSMYPVLSKYMPENISKAPEIHPIVAYSASEPYGNLLTNGRWKGTGGIRGARFTGELANNWLAAAGGGSVLNVVGNMPDGAAPIDRTDGLPGKWARFTISNAGGVNGENVQIRQTVDISSSNYTAGDVIIFTGTLRISSAVNVRDVAVVIGTNRGNNVLMGSSNPTDYFPLEYAGESPVYYLSSMPMIIGSGTTSINIYMTITLGAGGSVVIDVGQDWVMRKLV